MSRDTYHTIVGALVVLIVGVFLIVSYRSGQPGAVNDDGYRLTARFQEIDGVVPGTEVLLTGIKIGIVEKQYLDTDANKAVVVMRVRDGVEVPADSSVQVLSESMAGGKYLKISPGGDFEMLGPGDEIVYTQSSVRFEELLQKVILAAESRKRKAADDEKADDAEPGLNEGLKLPSLD